MNTNLNSNSRLANDIVDLQDTFTKIWHHEPDVDLPETSLSRIVISQHRCNFDLWHEEDKAREPNVSDAVIAQVKRNIDKLNQARNDLITQIDELLAESLFLGHENQDAPWNSETVGSIIDRLSIASLKVFHMREQAEREDANAEHIAACQEKLSKLFVQQKDLARALQEFVNAILVGQKQNRLYRQYKMYNDPALNPRIYAKQK